MRRKLTLAFLLTLIALGLPSIATRRSAALTGPAVTVYCYHLGFNRAECWANVLGGTSPYTYQWSPTPIIGDGEVVIMSCPGISLKTFTATVTDANGNSGSDSLQFQCCSTCNPQ